MALAPVSAGFGHIGGQPVGGLVQGAVIISSSPGQVPMQPHAEFFAAAQPTFEDFSDFEPATLRLGTLEERAGVVV